MSTQQSVGRDERTTTVENASYKWGYILLTYALFIDVMYRGAVRNEAAWDLLALVVVSSGISTVYQARQKTLPGWIAVFLVCLAGVAATLIAAMYHFHLLH